MKDPLRLVDAGGTEFERLLLTTAAEEAPSSEVSARMLAGVMSAGAAMALLSGAQVAGEGAAASGATQAGASAAMAAGAGGSIAPPAAAGLASTWLVKWGIIGALVSGAAVAGVVASGVVASGGEPVQARATAVAVPAPVPAVAGRPDAPHAAAPPSAVASPTQPEDGGPSRRPLPQRASGAQALGPEIEILDAARGALAQGEAERALTLIASYHRRFPSGALSQEATVLEVDALEARGRAEQATDLKQQFLAEHPESAHTQRVQRSGQAR